MSVKKSSDLHSKSRRTPRSASHTPARLRDRRRQGRRRGIITLALALALLVAGIVWGLNQPVLRISSVEFTDPEALLPGADPVALAKSAIAGTYWGLIPRDSALFYSAHRIRAAIISAHPEIAAITFAHPGFTHLVIQASIHTAVGRWCGLAPIAGVSAYCYLYDPNGFIYAAAPGPESGGATTTVQTVNSFMLYAPLVDNAQEPLRATIVHAERLPDAAAFARQIAAFGVEVRSVVIHEDEANLFVNNGTRISYVLGHEQEAYAALSAAKQGLNLPAGGVDYVDLRFPGKVYFKKKGE